MSTKITNSPPPLEPNVLKAPQVDVTNAFSDVDLPKRQTDYLQDGETRALARAEVKKLADNVRFIEEHFAVISRDMRALDQLELFHDRTGKPIAFHPDWEGLHDVLNPPL
jgi:hypothetical protein